MARNDSELRTPSVEFDKDEFLIRVDLDVKKKGGERSIVSAGVKAMQKMAEYKTQGTAVFRRDEIEALAKAHNELYGVAESLMDLIGLLLSSNLRGGAEERRRLAINAVKAKLKNDPKQEAKRAAKALWIEWQNGNLKFKSGAAFARHIVDKLPIDNTKTVEKWMRTWAQEKRNPAR